MKKELDETVFNTYTKESCYWAGFLAADGCIDVNGTIRIELAGKDKEHVYSFKDYCKSAHSVSHNIPKDSYKVGFNSYPIKEALLYNFGLDVNKTFNLIFPIFKEEWQYKAYIRGFFDGDGCFTEFFNNRPQASYRVYLANATLEFLEELLQFLKNTGVTTGGSIQKKGAKECWHIQLAVRDSTSFLNWIYSIDGPKLSRKYNKYKHIIVEGNRACRGKDEPI